MGAKYVISKADSDIQRKFLLRNGADEVVYPTKEVAERLAIRSSAKNMFGVIPGTMKPEYHYRFPKHSDFAEMILDINEFFKTRLCICDAVVGMEGNGPTMGKPRQIGAVLVSDSPHKLDLACAKIIGLEKKDVPTIEAAYLRGYIPDSADGLKVLDADGNPIVLDKNYDRLQTAKNLLPPVSIPQDFHR